VTTTLFALFPERWNQFSKKFETGAADYIGKRWASILNPYPQVEKAVFLDSLMPSEPDGFPAAYRRFIKVGMHPSEQVANLFELCFEKGYEKVIFAETICAALPDDFPAQFLEALENHDMVFLPAGDGSVLMAGMKIKEFRNWEFFQFHEAVAIVEILSICNENQLTYKLFEPYDIPSAENLFRKELSS
jgi:hypothetical protein